MKILKSAAFVSILLLSSLLMFSCKTTSVEVTDAAAVEAAAASGQEENAEKPVEYPVKKENTADAVFT